MRRLTFPLTVLWSSPFCWIPPMYVLTVGCVRCRRFQWPPASHCHIIPAPLTLSILLGFLLTSDRVRVKGIDQKKKAGGTGGLVEVWVEHWNCVKVLKLTNLNNWCVCCLAFPWRTPLGAAYLHSAAQERVCHWIFDVFECNDEGWCCCDFWSFSTTRRKL